MPITFVLGQNCDVILSHASIAAGVEVGFMLDRTQRDGGTVRVTRQAYQLTPGIWSDWVTIQARLVIGNNLTQPDGGCSMIPRDEYYDFLTAILAQKSGINFKFNAALGVFTVYTGLHLSRLYAEEIHGVGEFDFITITLNNGALPLEPPGTTIVNTISQVVRNEPATGLVNGSNATFTTAFAFAPETVEVTVNGVGQRRFVDYNTVGNNTIIFTSSPRVGDFIEVDYLRV